MSIINGLAISVLGPSCKSYSNTYKNDPSSKKGFEPSRVLVFVLVFHLFYLTLKLLFKLTKNVYIYEKIHFQIEFIIRSCFFFLDIGGDCHNNLKINLHRDL